MDKREWSTMPIEERPVVLDICYLTKLFGNRTVLQDLTLQIHAGEIFGFIGPNGSGKTTAIKLILGLLSMQSGRITICGKNIETEFEEAIRHTGGIIEKPELYKYLTGRQNLTYFASLYDNLPSDAVDRALALVGMRERADDKVRTYSLGMCQRIGIAQALLHRPDILILDEPTNGLDPGGIRDLRQILRKLADEEGVAVFISSHQLAELELFCDRYGILDQGRLVSLHTKEDLPLKTAAETDVKYDYLASTNRPELLAEAILQALPDSQAEVTEQFVTFTATNKEVAALYVEVFGSDAFEVYEVSRRKNSMEDNYLKAITEKRGGSVV